MFSFIPPMNRDGSFDPDGAYVVMLGKKFPELVDSSQPMCRSTLELKDWLDCNAPGWYGKRYPDLITLYLPDTNACVAFNLRWG
jgi:hypothetical protein